MGQNFSPTFEPGGDDVLTEAEAAAVEGAFGQAMPTKLDCGCGLCPHGWCMVLIDELDEGDGGEPPDFDHGGDGIGPPGGEDDGPGGSGGPGDGGDGGDDTDPNGDDNGDGILNKDDCLNAAFSGDPSGCDDDGDGVPNSQDCGSCQFVGDITQCNCSDVDISFSPGCTDRTPNYVWIIPTESLPKTVALTACGGPPGGTYQWTFTPSDVAILADGAQLDGPNLKVKLLNGGNFAATCQYTAQIDGQPCPVKFKVFQGAVVNKVGLESVEFSGGHTVLRDSGEAYPSPAWLDANLDGDANDEGDHSYPIAFTRNTPWRVSEAIVKLEPPIVNVGTVKLTMTSQGKPTIEATSTKIADGLKFASAPSTDPLPDTVDFNEALPIKWTLDFGCDDTPNEKVFNTTHQYYVTLGEPGVRVRHTVVHLACEGADGSSTESGVIGSIWAMFQHSLSTGLQRPTDHVWMTYWNPPNEDNQWLQKMLLAPLGNGCCTSWAALFRAMLLVHGVDGVFVKVIIPPGSTDVDKFLLVRNWAFAAQPSGHGLGCGGYDYLLGTDAINELGVGGQANDEPPPAFGSHFVVVLWGSIYDPSYGIGPVPSWDVYEWIAFAGYGRKCGDNYLASPEDPFLVNCTYLTSPEQE